MPGKKKTIVLLETMPVPVVLEHSQWFLDELADLGYIPDKTMELIRLNADGDREKARQFLLRVLSEKNPDLVVTNATLASQEAMAVLSGLKIPQLFFTVADPVGAGLISRIGVPSGTNITGLVYSMDQKIKIKNALRCNDLIAVPGNDDNRNLQSSLLERFQEFKPGAVGQHMVRKNHIDGSRLEPIKCLLLINGGYQLDITEF